MIPRYIICEKCGGKIYIDPICWKCRKKGFKKFEAVTNGKQRKL